MFYVYLLRIKTNPEKTYIGITSNLKRRIYEHNKGVSKSTKDYIPWIIEVYIAFEDERKAKDFEKYLKQGSGHAFAKNHFWSVK